MLTLTIGLIHPVWANGTNTDEQTHWLENFQEDPELFSFDGYRIQRYRSPTPEHSKFATTLSTEDVQTLLVEQPQAILLDVQPLPWNGLFIHKKVRRKHIPGSVWLPNVGLGELEDDWSDYFSHHLSKLTKGNKQTPIVLYCRADCWMSWNAIKRAAEWGYNNLYWFRDGTDAWRENELEMVIAEPEPFPIKTN